MLSQDLIPHLYTEACIKTSQPMTLIHAYAKWYLPRETPMKRRSMQSNHFPYLTKSSP